MENFFQNVKNYIMDSDLAKYVIIWSVFGFLLLFNILFQIPINPLKNQLNLSNNAPYFQFDGLPVDVDNSYKQEVTLKMHLTDNDGRRIVDYFMDEDFLFIIQENKILKYDIETNSVVKKYYLPGDVNNNYFNMMFFMNNDFLYFYSSQGLYKITEEELIKIGDINSDNSRRVRLSENDFAFLKNMGNQTYVLLLLENDTVSVEETIDLTSTGYDELLVVSETLFYKNGNDYTLFSNSDITFEAVEAGSVYYNSSYQVLHYLKDNSIYINDGQENLKVVDYVGRRLVEGETVGDVTILRDGNELDETRLLIFNYDMSIISVYNHLDLDRFYKLKDYNVSYVVNYRYVDDKIQFMQVESNGEHTYFQIYNLEAKEVDLSLAFYSHYGIFTIVVILLAIFIPITDDIKYLTYIDFKSVTKQD